MIKQDLANMLGGRIRYLLFTATFKDLQATSGSGAKLIPITDQNNSNVAISLPARGKVLGVEVKHSVAFAGGSLSAMTVSLGVSGSVTRYTATFDIFQAVSDTALQETAMFKSVQRSAQALTLNFTPTSDNCSAATAGIVEVSVCYLDISTTFTLPA